MAQLFWLSAGQIDRIHPLCPKERGVKRVDDRKVLSGIIPVIQKGLSGWMPRGLWSLQTPLQPFSPLVRQGCF